MTEARTMDKAHKKSKTATLISGARAGKMSQAALAEACNVHRTTIALIEQGRALPGEDLLRDIAKTLRVKISDLTAAKEDDAEDKGLAKRRSREGAVPRDQKPKATKKSAPAKPATKKKVAPAPKKTKKEAPKPSTKKKPVPKKAKPATKKKTPKKPAKPKGTPTVKKTPPPPKVDPAPAAASA